MNFVWFSHCQFNKHLAKNSTESLNRVLVVFTNFNPFTFRIFTLNFFQNFSTFTFTSLSSLLLVSLVTGWYYCMLLVLN